MTHSIVPVAEPSTRREAIPWLAFLCIGAVFFYTTHNVFQTQRYAERGATGFIATPEEAEALMAGYERGQLGNAVAYLALGAFGVLSLIRAGQKRLFVQGIFGGAVLFFVAWCFVSLLWAENAVSTAKKLAILLMLCIATAAVLRRFSERDVLRLVLTVMSVYVVAGILAEVAFGAFRPWMGWYRFSGTCHPNGQAMDCALLFLAAFYLRNNQRARRALLAIAVFAFVCLIFTKSRTSLAAAVIAPLTFWGLAASRGRKIMAFLSVGAAVALFLLVSGVVLPAVEQSTLMGRTDTDVAQTKSLTGRTGLWKEAFSSYIVERPLLGYGYNSFWTQSRAEEFADIIGFTSGSAHSVFVELFLGLGVVGVIAYFGISIAAVVISLRYYNLSRDASYAFCGALIIFSLIHGLTESAFLFPSLPTFLSMVVLGRLAFLAPPQTAAAIGDR